MIGLAEERDEQGSSWGCRSDLRGEGCEIEFAQLLQIRFIDLIKYGSRFVHVICPGDACIGDRILSLSCPYPSGNSKRT